MSGRTVDVTTTRTVAVSSRRPRCGGVSVDSNTDSHNADTRMSEPGEICVVTHPLSNASEAATRTLLDVLGELTVVSLLTANLPTDSSVRDEHEVIEISARDEGDSIPVAAVRFLSNQLRMAAVLSRREEETVLFFGATSYLVPIVVATLAGKTVVLEPRGDVPLTLCIYWERRVPAPLARALAGSVRALEWVGYLLADGIVTYTPSMAEELGVDRFEGKLHPHGARYVDTERFAPTTRYEDREPVVGFLGRLDEGKGIRALATVAKQLPDGTRFRFIGGGGLEEWLRTELADEIAAGDVEATGWVDHSEVPAELNRLRLLVLPSQPTEGLPTVILEALACGTPVYATPVSGVPDVVQEEETGFLMDDPDADAIRRDIGAIFERGDLPEISRNGRELIENEYSFEAAVERYRTILDAVGR
jgi:glycosyltransferase involved in cell wall biosynthesis